MQTSLRLAAAASVVAALFTLCLAQNPDMTPSFYVDAKTGINFTTWTQAPGDGGNGAFTFGLVLPGDAATKNATEYLGLLRCQSISASQTGWCGISHAGHMTQDLLLMAWPDQSGAVRTSLRWASDYFMPVPYVQAGGSSSNNTTASNSTLTSVAPLNSWSNASEFGLVYRCRNCFAWTQGNYSESEPTASDAGSVLVLGYAQAGKGPLNAACPDQITFGFHDNGYGQWGVPVANATSASYAAWAALPAQAAPAVPASCLVSGGPSARASATATATAPGGTGTAVV